MVAWAARAGIQAELSRAIRLLPHQAREASDLVARRIGGLDTCRGATAARAAIASSGLRFVDYPDDRNRPGGCAATIRRRRARCVARLRLSLGRQAVPAQLPASAWHSDGN